jgi:chromosome partitioning protein
MPVIPFVSPKGGTGKSTSALSLATLLAKIYDVTIIDADANQPIKDWANGGNVPPRLTVISDVDEDTIIDRIAEAAAKTPFVIVDLEGTASKIVLYAISQADFVVIPTQGSHEDAKAAGRAVRVIRQSEKMSRTTIPHAVLFTRTSPMIRSRTLAHIRKSLADAGVPVFKTELNERDAFKALFSFQQTLDGLDPAAVPNLQNAKANVGEFAHEMITRLATEQGATNEETEATPTANEGAA